MTTKGFLLLAVWIFADIGSGFVFAETPKVAVTASKLAVTHRFGVVGPDERLPIDLVITNDTQKPLELVQAMTSCGCFSVIKCPKAIEPGEGGTAKFALNAVGQHGSISHSVTITTTNPAIPALRLDVHAIVAGVWCDPDVVRMGSIPVDKKDARIHELHILAVGIPDAEIADIKIGDRSVEFHEGNATADRATRNRKIDVLRRVSLQWVGGTKSLGPFQTELVVTMTKPAGSSIVIPIRGSVVSSVTSAPSTLVFGKVADQPVTRHCKLQRPSDEFEIDLSKSVLEASHEWIQPSISNQGNETKLTVVLNPPSAGTSGVVKGSITGFVDKRPVFVVPYVAFFPDKPVTPVSVP